MNARDSFNKSRPEHLPDTNTGGIYYEPVHKPLSKSAFLVSDFGNQGETSHRQAVCVIDKRRSKRR